MLMRGGGARDSAVLLNPRPADRLTSAASLWPIFRSRRMLRTRYSRQFESEADDYAFAMLKRHGQSPQAFADMMRRLRLRKDAKEEPDALLQYLSTHPATEERIQRAEQQR